MATGNAEFRKHETLEVKAGVGKDTPLHHACSRRPPLLSGGMWAYGWA